MAPNRNTINIREIILLAVCIFFAYKTFFKKPDLENKSETIKRAMATIDSLERENEIQHCISDSLKAEASILSKVIENQKNNQQIITKKYDKIRGNINLLNADSSISYLSGKVSKEGNH